MQATTMLTEITTDDLNRALTNREGLYTFLRDRLNWRVDPDDTFAYTETEVSESVADRAQVFRLLPFTASDPYALFLVEFDTPPRRTDLREILRTIRKRIRTQAAYGTRDLESLVFVGVEPGYTGIFFAHFEEREGRNPRLRLFGFQKDALSETRTLRSVNLPALYLGENLLGEPDWDAAKRSWDTAWDIEKVTKAFFKDYKEVFEWVRDRGIGEVQGDKQLFTQRLFNRLLFIHFLSKKRWLKVGERTDYLFALRDLSRRNNANFYRDHLWYTFFVGLGVSHGGLFERVAPDDLPGAVTVSNEAFDRIFDRLFAVYNFTVVESQPDDAEVAVDPEMLGKVFEELVTGRHESGSYYTPRPVVAFMCREALKAYLGNDYAPLIESGDRSGISLDTAKYLLDKLEIFTCVDPACGSGAYLLGMMQEIFTLYRLLDPLAKSRTARDDYKRKLSIITNNLYGVDKEEFAVQMARLRLWLSLVVEYEGDTPEPLPNLDFKIEIGDSLTAPDPSQGKSLSQEAVRAFKTAKDNYGDPEYPGDKTVLRSEIALLRGEIALWEGRNTKEKADDAFDWRVEFAEVMHHAKGFDAVLANPPYVRQELLGKEYKEKRLKPVFPQVYSGTADIYCYFYARGLQLLKPGGALVFISSNKWFRAGYGKGLREHIAQTCAVRGITDFGDLPVFESATAYPMIFAATKGARKPSDPPAILTEPKSLLPPYPDVLGVVRTLGHTLPSDAIAGSEWRLTDAATGDRVRTMRAAGIPLGEYVNGKIYRGIMTGLNEAFVIDDATRTLLIAEDAKSAEIIKPLAAGRDIRRWVVNSRDQWLIFTRRGVDIEQYPAVKRHLEQWKAKLTPKKDGASVGRAPGDYKWYELQASPANEERFIANKIVYQEIATHQSFAFDTNSVYFNNKVWMLIVDDLYLLGVLNAQPVWDYLNDTCTRMMNGAIAMQSIHVLTTPIPNATPEEKSAIATLVQTCLDKKGENCGAEEAEINARVAALYGL